MCSSLSLFLSSFVDDFKEQRDQTAHFMSDNHFLEKTRIQSPFLKHPRPQTHSYLQRVWGFLDLRRRSLLHLFAFPWFLIIYSCLVLSEITLDINAFKFPVVPISQLWGKKSGEFFFKWLQSHHLSQTSFHILPEPFRDSSIPEWLRHDDEVDAGSWRRLISSLWYVGWEMSQEYKKHIAWW